MTEEQFIDALVKMGFLKYAPPAEVELLRQQLLGGVKYGVCGTEWDVDSSKDKRTYFADSENLMEGGIGQNILEMKDVLEAEGVRLESVEDVSRSDSYHVRVNERLYTIYDPHTTPDRLLRGIATRRFLEIVNELLGDAGSDERLYWIGGGDEGQAILLTPAMYDLLASSGLSFSPDWMPRPSDAIDEHGSAVWYWRRDDGSAQGQLRRWSPEKGWEP